MFIFSIIFRLLWSVTIGLPFFVVGLILFLLFDIFSPKSDRGYKILNTMYKWGSCYWFKGLRMEKDEFEIDVTKRRNNSN
jgi:hypothetical protein